nr:hypothetical protein [Tanacetum cinerariifolium]
MKTQTKAKDKRSMEPHVWVAMGSGIFFPTAKLEHLHRIKRAQVDLILPVGNVSFVYRNIEGLNRSIIDSIVTISMLNPQVGHWLPGTP